MPLLNLLSLSLMPLSAPFGASPEETAGSSLRRFERKAGDDEWLHVLGTTDLVTKRLRIDRRRTKLGTRIEVSVITGESVQRDHGRARKHVATVTLTPDGRTQSVTFLRLPGVLQNNWERVERLRAVFVWIRKVNPGLRSFEIDRGERDAPDLWRLTVSPLPLTPDAEYRLDIRRVVGKYVVELGDPIWKWKPPEGGPGGSGGDRQNPGRD